jgi:hypothetical protein
MKHVQNHAFTPCQTVANVRQMIDNNGWRQSFETYRRLPVFWARIHINARSALRFQVCWLRRTLSLAQRAAAASRRGRNGKFSHARLERRLPRFENKPRRSVLARGAPSAFAAKRQRAPE